MDVCMVYNPQKSECTKKRNQTSSPEEDRRVLVGLPSEGKKELIDSSKSYHGKKSLQIFISYISTPFWSKVSLKIKKMKKWKRVKVWNGGSTLGANGFSCCRCIFILKPSSACLRAPCYLSWVKIRDILYKFKFRASS